MNICLQYLYTPNTILNTCGNIHNQTLEIGDRLYIYLNLSFVQQINIFCVPSSKLEAGMVHKKENLVTIWKGGDQKLRHHYFLFRLLVETNFVLI